MEMKWKILVAAVLFVVVCSVIVYGGIWALAHIDSDDEEACCEDLDPSIELYVMNPAAIDLSENNMDTREYMIEAKDMHAYTGVLTIESENIYPINITVRCAGEKYPLYDNGSSYGVRPVYNGIYMFNLHPDYVVVFDLIFTKLADFSDGNLTLKFGYLAGHIDKYCEVIEGIFPESSVLTIPIKGGK